MVFRHRVLFVTLASSNLDRLVEFYQYLFGFPPTLHMPQRYAEFQLSGLRLGIFQPQSDNISEFVASSSGKMSLCFEVENLEDAMKAIELAYTSLAIAPGDRQIMGNVITASHGREIYAYDMDGNRLILHEANS